MICYLCSVKKRRKFYFLNDLISFLIIYIIFESFNIIILIISILFLSYFVFSFINDFNHENQAPKAYWLTIYNLKKKNFISIELLN